jgi:hypothetical protein
MDKWIDGFVGKGGGRFHTKKTNIQLPTSNIEVLRRLRQSEERSSWKVASFLRSLLTGHELWVFGLATVRPKAGAAPQSKS